MGDREWERERESDRWWKIEMGWGRPHTQTHTSSKRFWSTGIDVFGTVDCAIAVEDAVDSADVDVIVVVVVVVVVVECWFLCDDSFSFRSSNITCLKYSTGGTYTNNWAKSINWQSSPNLHFPFYRAFVRCWTFDVSLYGRNQQTPGRECSSLSHTLCVYDNLFRLSVGSC